MGKRSVIAALIVLTVAAAVTVALGYRNVPAQLIDCSANPNAPINPNAQECRTAMGCLGHCSAGICMGSCVCWYIDDKQNNDGMSCPLTNGMGVCEGGSCVGSNSCLLPSQCEDRNACTNNECVNGQCSYTNISNCPTSPTADPGQSCTAISCCSNGAATTVTPTCTGNTSCVNGTCKFTCQGNDDCNDRDPCTTNTCVNGACVFPPGACSSSSAFSCGSPNQVYCGQGVSQSNVCCAQGACQTASNGLKYCGAGSAPTSSENPMCWTQVGCWYEMCMGNLWVCEDGDPCTDDKCTAGGDQNGVCEHQPWAIPIDGCTSSAGGTTGGDTGGGSSNANSGGSSGGSSTGSSGSSGSSSAGSSTGGNSSGGGSSGAGNSSAGNSSGGSSNQNSSNSVFAVQSSSFPCIPNAPAPFGCPSSGSLSSQPSQASSGTSNPGSSQPSFGSSAPGSSTGSSGSANSSSGGSGNSSQPGNSSGGSSSSGGSGNSSSSAPCSVSSLSIASSNSSSSHSSSSAAISPCSASSAAPVSHTACIQSACVLIDGPGVSTCTTSADCGGGSSTSTSFAFSFGNSSFSFSFSNPAQHTVCQNAACVIVAGPGANECSTAFQCGTQNHLICRNAMCEVVPGPGGNQCDDAFDCLFAFSSNSFSFANSFSSASFSFEVASSAVFAFCGDGVVQSPESCDNALANSDTGDGACRSDCTPARCGDFVVDVSRGETCDQGIGNKNDVADRCRLTCQLPACGDGMKDSGEQCDDGNLRSNDGCSATCKNETVLVAGLVCGDGRLDPGESCDDGNRRSGDGCSSACSPELSGCTTDAQCSIGTCQNGSCGPCAADRECSEGNRCIQGSCIPIQGSLVASTLVCGDGTRSGFEECDDGNLRDRDGCSVDCYLERGFCGDGTIQRALGETCEPALHDKTLPFTCNPASCRLLSKTCGDAKIQAGEECDLGAENNKATPGAACRPDCSFPRCGDRVLDTSEACDDGNRLSGDGCSASCTLEQGAASTIPFPTSQPGTDSLNPLQGFPLGNQAPLWATLPVVNAHAPIGDTGPAAVAVIASGAAAGFAWMRRKR